MHSQQACKCTAELLTSATLTLIYTCVQTCWPTSSQCLTTSCCTSPQFKSEMVCHYGYRDARSSWAVWWSTSWLSADAPCLLPPWHAPPPWHAAAAPRHASTASMTCPLFLLSKDCLCRRVVCLLGRQISIIRFSAIVVKVSLKQQRIIHVCYLCDCSSVIKRFIMHA